MLAQAVTPVVIAPDEKINQGGIALTAGKAPKPFNGKALLPIKVPQKRIPERNFRAGTW